MAQGKLIAFEGGDGSGKGTQLSLLTETFKSRNIAFEIMDFPRYGKSFFGDLAGRMLAGDFGGIDATAAELAVLPFACDRWLVKDDLKKWLSEGKIVISNRYTASSAVYQATKLQIEKQYPFLDWVYKLEQDVIGLPHEDVVLFFHVPVAVSQTLIDKKGARAYLGDKKKDIYEESVAVQEAVERLYLALAQMRSNWKTVECVENGAIRTPEAIQKDILDVLAANEVL